MRSAHNPRLDGIRALAALTVLAFHAGHLPGGAVGVDVFFVLSGYLISTIGLAEISRTGTINVGVILAALSFYTVEAFFRPLGQARLAPAKNPTKALQTRRETV